MSLRDGKNIAFDDFGNTNIPVPPIKVQEQISNYLEEKEREEFSRLKIIKKTAI